MGIIVECPKCGKNIAENTVDKEFCWICRSKLIKREESSGQSGGFSDEKSRALVESLAAKDSRAPINKFKGNLKFLFFIIILILAFIFVPKWFEKSPFNKKAISEYTTEFEKGAQDAYDSKIAAPLESFLKKSGFGGGEN